MSFHNLQPQSGSPAWNQSSQPNNDIHAKLGSQGWSKELIQVLHHLGLTAVEKDCCFPIETREAFQKAMGKLFGGLVPDFEIDARGGVVCKHDPGELLGNLVMLAQSRNRSAWTKTAVLLTLSSATYKMMYPNPAGAVSELGWLKVATLQDVGFKLDTQTRDSIASVLNSCEKEDGVDKGAVAELREWLEQHSPTPSFHDDALVITSGTGTAAATVASTATTTTTGTLAALTVEESVDKLWRAWFTEKTIEALQVLGLNLEDPADLDTVLKAPARDFMNKMFQYRYEVRGERVICQESEPSPQLSTLGDQAVLRGMNHRFWARASVLLVLAEFDVRLYRNLGTDSAEVKDTFNQLQVNVSGVPGFRFDPQTAARVIGSLEAAAGFGFLAGGVNGPYVAGMREWVRNNTETQQADNRTPPVGATPTATTTTTTSTTETTVTSTTTNTATTPLVRPTIVQPIIKGAYSAAAASQSSQATADAASLTWAKAEKHVGQLARKLPDLYMWSVQAKSMALRFAWDGQPGSGLKQVDKFETEFTTFLKQATNEAGNAPEERAKAEAAFKGQVRSHIADMLLAPYLRAMYDKVAGAAGQGAAPVEHVAMWLSALSAVEQCIQGKVFNHLQAGQLLSYLCTPNHMDARFDWIDLARHQFAGKPSNVADTQPEIRERLFDRLVFDVLIAQLPPFQHEHSVIRDKYANAAGQLDRSIVDRTNDELRGLAQRVMNNTPLPPDPFGDGPLFGDVTLTVTSTTPFASTADIANPASGATSTVTPLPTLSVATAHDRAASTSSGQTKKASSRSGNTTRNWSTSSAGQTKVASVSKPPQSAGKRDAGTIRSHGKNTASATDDREAHVQKYVRRLVRAIAANNDTDFHNACAQLNADELNCEASNGHTALTLACKLGATKMVEALLDRNANVDVGNKQRQSMTPLCFAVVYGHVEIVKLLLEKNASLEYGGGGNVATIGTKVYSKEIKNMLKKAAERDQERCITM